jgi:hypothetical protein
MRLEYLVETAVQYKQRSQQNLQSHFGISLCKFPD